MTLSPNINSREFDKFVDTADGTSVRVSLSGGMAPDSYDEIAVTYPTAVTEVYTFKLATVTVSVVTVTYVDSTKEQLTSVVRS